MATYIWQRQSWPNFIWNAARLIEPLARARHQQGLFLGKMRQAGMDTRLISELEATAEDAVKTSAIEGEVLNPASVRSSIARRLGLPEAGLTPADRRVEGVVEMLMDAGKRFDRPLTAERILGWHASLFPTGYSGMDKIDIGTWRTDRLGPMQVISNPFAIRPKVHFEAPPAARIGDEMTRFLTWFANGSGEADPLLRAGIAHLWFVTIHPLDDGNGRIARAIADLAIAQAERTGQRFYSMSAAIEREKARYYETLEATQRGELDVTEWLIWFCECYGRAIAHADQATEGVLSRARFWAAHADARPFSERQRKVLAKLLDGFEGPMTSRKWAGICQCSHDTAQRDIADLVARGLLEKNSGGSRSTSYRFVWPPAQDSSRTDE